VGKIKTDSPVVIPWLTEVENMVNDLRMVNGKKYPSAEAILADAREIKNLIKPTSIDAVITSPPYPNEKDYTRTTRLESVFLGFISSKDALRNHKKNFVRSNTRGVYKEDRDDEWVADNLEIQRIAEEIEKRRIELGKTSGFEKLYSRVTKLYFGGMTRHLLELRRILRPGAQLAYVVGDQASYLRIMIQTGQILAKIAEEIGYEVIRIDLFRKRFATATKQELREEVVILKWKG
jgi:DNA modification methylase